MKVYVIYGMAFYADKKTGEVDKDSIEEACQYEICSSLDVAIECLEADGFKPSDEYDKRYKPIGTTKERTGYLFGSDFHRVSDYYWDDSAWCGFDNEFDDVRQIFLSWVREEEILEKVDWVFDVYDGTAYKYKKRCGNCKHWDFDWYSYEKELYDDYIKYGNDNDFYYIPDEYVDNYMDDFLEFYKNNFICHCTKKDCPHNKDANDDACKYFELGEDIEEDYPYYK